MTTAIRAGTFIDGNGRDPVRDAVIVVEGDTITAVAKDVPRGAAVIDASALTVMPGMIDCHIHLWFGPSSIQQRLLKPYSLVAAEAFQNAKLTLDHGFTSVRDAGGTPRGVKMTPMQAIVATTKTAAACARIGDLTGTLEVGKRADLIGVRGDPLSDIGLLQKEECLPLVMKDGIVHKDRQS